MPTPEFGEIWDADLEPVKGHEQGGFRPVLIISHDAFNSVPHGMHLPRIEWADPEETIYDRECQADVVRTLRRSNLRGLQRGKPGRRVCSVPQHERPCRGHTGDRH